MNRLANASSRSTSLYDLRTKQDDDCCDVDPGEEPCRERERPVGREQGERSREVAERQLGDLPQHGRYQRALDRGSPRRPVSRDDPVDDVEKNEADREAGEWREQPHSDPDDATETRADQSVGYRRRAEREAERDERKDRERGDETRGLEVSADEAPSAFPPQDHRERAIERAVDRHRREDGPDHADGEGEGASLYQLVGDARLLGGGRGIDVAKDLDEIVLGSVRAVREGQDADEEGEERDQSKEDLVRDRAGEKRAIVCGEAHDDGSAARKSAG